jgi:hypothetical protein
MIDPWRNSKISGFQNCQNENRQRPAKPAILQQLWQCCGQFGKLAANLPNFWQR